MPIKDLDSLKYTELQKLAKSVGIKANQKHDKLLKALKEHHRKTAEDCQGSSKNGSSSNSERKNSTHSREATPSSSEATAKSTANATKPLKGTPKFHCASMGKSPAIRSPAIFSPMQWAAAQNSKKATPSTPLSAKKAVGGTAVAHQLPTPTATTVTVAATGSDGKPNKKRRRTFELDEPTLSGHNTPSSDGQPRATRQRTSQTSTPTAQEEGPATKRARKNSNNNKSPAQTNNNNSSRQQTEISTGSPGTRAMIESMDADLPSAERKAKLLSALDKKVQNKVSASPAQQTASQPSQIPRFMAFLANKNKTENSKPVTPGNKDWTKIHQKEFSKFDSLDVYLEKKQQRIQKLTGSAKRSAVTKSPRRNNAKVVKPVRGNHVQVKPFIPTVTSTKNISFNFSKTPASMTPSAQKTGANGTLSQTITKTPNTQTSAASARKSLGTNTRTTPYRFTGNNSTLNTTVTSQKKIFDLKASLAKPLTWKPYTGKLQPMDINKPVLASSATKTSVQAPRVARASRQVMASKTRATQAKDVRRAKQLDRRNNQKYIDMMKRRGLMA